MNLKSFTPNGVFLALFEWKLTAANRAVAHKAPPPPQDLLERLFRGSSQSVPGRSRS